jgi:hypothetical protein
MPVGLHHPTATPHRCPPMKGVPTMSDFIDLSGQTFGRLIALYRDPRPKTSSGRVISHFLCQCLCGKYVSVQSAHLRSGHTTSCGCWHHQLVQERSTKHGAARRRHVMPEYRSWCHMHSRCTNPRDAKYRLYGARGITVVESWQDFPQFLADMGPRPSPLHTIERRNNDGPYSPENCYWATPAQQSRNTRQTVFLTWNHETLCLTDWAHRIGIHETSLRYRLRHWPYDKVFTTPPQWHSLLTPLSEPL